MGNISLRNDLTALLTGPITKPPILQADRHQTGAANHPLHAPPTQRYSSPLTIAVFSCVGALNETRLMENNLFFSFFCLDMTFTHEGNKTFVDNMVNFEKMVRLSNESRKRHDLCHCVSPPQEYFLFSPQRIIANTIRQVRHCRSQAFSKSDTPQSNGNDTSQHFS